MAELASCLRAGSDAAADLCHFYRPSECDVYANFQFYARTGKELCDGFLVAYCR